MEVDLGKYRKFNSDAWMCQHTATREKWLYYVVFATPRHPKSTSNKQTKNLYFRNLQTKKFWIIVVSVERDRPTRQD